MVVIKRSIEIDGSRARVWNRAVDFGRMPEWFYGEKRVAVQARPPGVGTEQIVTILTGQSYRERFVEWIDNERYSLYVLDPPWFIKAWNATVTVRPASGDGAWLDWDIRIAVRYGIAGKIFGACLLRPFIAAVLTLSLRRLKAQIERS